MSRTTIAILSALLFLLFLSACVPSLRGFWVEHPGVLIVAFAVAGEVACDLKPEKSFTARLKQLFGVLLVVGLIVEIREAIKADAQIAVLKDRAATNELARVKLEVDLEALRADNLALYKQIQPRRITPEQRSIVLDEIAKLGPIKKCWFEVVSEIGDAESNVFAKQILRLAGEAGYDVHDGGSAAPNPAVIRFGASVETSPHPLGFDKGYPPQSAVALIKALKNAKVIDAEGIQGNPKRQHNDPTVPFLRIRVHPKPLPVTDEKYDSHIRRK